MDRIECITRGKKLLSKYKYALLILAVGMILMSLPDEEKPAITQVQPVSDKELTQAQQLEEILAEIHGVGRVKVMLTEAVGAETVFQTDTDRTTSTDSESMQVDTVIITNSEREEQGLVRSITPPVYLGAIIVCQGGDNPSIKLSIVQAVSNVTGISSDRITVLKMK